MYPVLGLIEGPMDGDLKRVRLKKKTSGCLMGDIAHFLYAKENGSLGTLKNYFKIK